MATKAGRVEIHDIKAGKTFWKAAIVDGVRVPMPVTIVGKAYKVRMQRQDGSYVAIWAYRQQYRQLSDTLETRLLTFTFGTVICDPMWSPHNEANEPLFDKLFVNRSAVVRWINRYNSNRVTTLCEDRRIFTCGDRPLRAVAQRQPDQLDLERLQDHRFQHAELWYAKHYGAHRPAKLNETPHG